MKILDSFNVYLHLSFWVGMQHTPSVTLLILHVCEYLKESALLSDYMYNLKQAHRSLNINHKIEILGQIPQKLYTLLG